MRAQRVGALMMGGAIALGAAGAFAGGFRLGAPTGPDPGGWTAYYAALFVLLVTGAYLTGIDRIAARPSARSRSQASLRIAIVLALLAGFLLALSFAPVRPARAEGARAAAAVAACIALSMGLTAGLFLLLDRRGRAPSP